MRSTRVLAVASISAGLLLLLGDRDRLALVGRGATTLRAMTSSAAAHGRLSRVDYSLHRNGTFTNMFSWHGCTKANRRDLPAAGVAGLLDFTATVRLRDLRVLVMGDSVGLQLAAYLEEALLRGADSQRPFPRVDLTEQKYEWKAFNRSVLKYEWKKNPSIALTHMGDGSALATWRMLGMLGRKGANRWRPNMPAKNKLGGFMTSDVNMLLEHLSSGGSEDRDAGRNKFHAMLFRIPHGWIDLNEITEQRLNETVEVARDLFGVDTIIFTTVPFSNNIEGVGNFRRMSDTNAMIRRFCRKCSGDVRVLMLEIDSLMRALMEDNARGMGYDSAANDTYWADRVARVPDRQHPGSVAQVCGERPLTFPSDYCPVRSSFSEDGMHYCMNQIGGRLIAAVACLLDCVYNINSRNSAYLFGEGLDDCASGCNRQFMSLEPVAEDMYVR